MVRAVHWIGSGGVASNGKGAKTCADEIVKSLSSSLDQAWLGLGCQDDGREPSMRSYQRKCLNRLNTLFKVSFNRLVHHHRFKILKYECPERMNGSNVMIVAEIN